MALNKAADADTVYWSLAGCTRVPRPGMSGGTVAGRGEPSNRCWGARGYADLTTIFGSCRGQINKLWARRQQLRVIWLITRT